MKTITQIGGLLATLAFLATPVIAGDADTPLRVITVTGKGEATAAPDMATITTGVSTQATAAADALAINNKAMAKLLAVLKKQGIAKKDVQTANFSVSPIYKRDDKGRTLPEVEAYRVVNQVRVIVRNLESLGKVLDGLVSAGSNRISGIQFGVDDPSGILNQARSQAIRNAKERAEVYAQAAGVKVGAVIQISEQSINPPQPVQLGRRMDFAFAKASSVPVATGEQTFRVQIHVMYELK